MKFDKKNPEIGLYDELNIDDSVFIADSSTVVGSVTLGRNASVWFGATIRGDMAPVTIGENTNIQENAVIHVDFDFPTFIGKNITVGHSAIVHGATVKDNSLIGMRAVLLNGAVVGENCIIGAGAIVMEGQVIPDNSIVFGVPAKVAKPVTQEMLDRTLEGVNIYVQYARKYRETSAHKVLPVLKHN